MKKKGLILLVVGIVLSIGYIMILPQITKNAGWNKNQNDILVSGNVFFDDYQKGFIFIGAYDKPDFVSKKLIASTFINKPGVYTITIPAETASNLKNLYITGYNDSDDDGGPFRTHDPFGVYDNNNIPAPIALDDKVIQNIDLHFIKDAISTDLHEKRFSNINT
jgi:hypothetical protein